MRLTPLVLAAAAVTLPLAPALAQLRSSRPPPQLTNLPRLLVANPFSGMGQPSRVRPPQLAADAPMLLIATGLALRRFDA